MLYKKVQLFIPTKGGKQFVRGEENRGKSCVAKVISQDDPLKHEKLYVSQDYWHELERTSGKDGYFGQKMLKPQLTLLDITEKIPYNDERMCLSAFQRELQNAIHIGQRKLFISEIQHLAAKLESADEEAVVIYAGSAPSNKAWLIHQLFPNVKFIFVDPNEFYLYVDKFDKSHYTDAESGLYCYLSYSNSNSYISGNVEWRRKHIKYYNPSTGKVVDIRDKEFGRSLSADERAKIDAKIRGLQRNVKETEHEVISGYATQESFDFVFQSDYRFYFCEEYFTDETAAKIANAISKANFAGKVLFWSDIRTNLNAAGHPADLDIIWNTAMMYSWLRIIKPDYAMVKFRPPFFMSKEVNYSAFQNDFDIAKQHGYDFITGTQNRDGIHFFAGVIYLQAWPGCTSAETRLWINKQDIIANNMIAWQLKDYEERMFRYNIIDRYALLHENSNANQLIGFDHCNDCAIENTVWVAMKEKIPSLDILSWVCKLNDILHVKILDRRGDFCHGHLFPATLREA